MVLRPRRGANMVARPRTLGSSIDSKLKALGFSIGSNPMHKVEHIAER